MPSPPTKTLDWQRIRIVFDAAIEKPPGDRTRYIAERCPEPPVRSAVESLVLAWQQAGDFMDDTVLAMPEVPGTGICAGRRVGAYRIIAEIGGGGMGTVYRAVRADDEYEKTVAIKFVRSGFSSGFLLSRFRAERQILATLEHPNIARLLDAGTEDGCPYLVMEMIEGEPVDEYCDRLCLPVKDRLNLFRTICSAVQYAHQHLIVHRDIKPSNILVTKDGTPKLLDFGIAKLLDSGKEGAAETGGMLMLTPEYASPEQLRGEPISTATDVYSLGLLLYVLLTGRHPFRKQGQSATQLMQAICESEPLPPSLAALRQEEASGRVPELLSSVREGAPERLQRRLAGDLDNIVLQALSKTLACRYQSVHDLSEDILRHLEGLPVRARENTWLYRTRKFLRRNRTSVLAIALILLLLVSGLLVTVREARIANQRFQDVRAIASSDLFEVHDALEKIPGSAPVRHMLIQRALKYLDRLNGEHLADATLLTDIAEGYEKVAGMQGSFSAAGIGDSKASLDSYSKALAIRTILANRSGSFGQLEARARTLHKYSRALHLSGRTQDSLEAAERELKIANQLLEADPGRLAARERAAEAHQSVAFVLAGTGSSTSLREIPSALDHDRRAVAIRNEIVRNARSADSEGALGYAQLLLAEHLSKARKFREARELFARLDAEADARPTRYIFADTIHNRFGLMLERLGEDAASLAQYRKSFELAAARLKTDHEDVDARTKFQIASGHIGVQEARLGIAGAGTAALDTAVQGLEKAWEADPAQTFYANVLLIGYGYQGELLSLRGDQTGALEKYRLSLNTAERLTREDPADLESPLSIAKLLESIAVIESRSKHYSEAQRQFAQSLDAAEQLLRKRPDDTETLQIRNAILGERQLIQACRDLRPCAATAQLRLRSLVN